MSIPSIMTRESIDLNEGNRESERLDGILWFYRMSPECSLVE